METSIEFNKPISAPIIKNQEYGKMYIEIDGRPKLTISLVAEKNVSKVNPFVKILAAAKYLLFGTSLDEN